MTKTARPPAGISVTPPSLHPGQLEVLRDPARFKLLRAGRRWRKSGLGTIQAMLGYADGSRPGALQGGRIGWWVPSLTSRYLVADWAPLRQLAAQIPGSRIEEANHRVIMPSGGWVLMLSADNVDSGRGLGLDGAVLDEAQLLSEQLWAETVRSTLIDREGWALFLFTPPRTPGGWLQRFAADMANRPDWKEFHYRTADNPFIPTDELESITGEMSTLVKLVEIDAEWPSVGAGVFQRGWIQYWRPGDGTYVLGETDVPVRGCRVFCTVDLAWSLEERADYTVIAIWAVTPHKALLLLDVIRDHIGGPQIVPTMQAVNLRWSPSYFVMERGTTQLAIVRDAQRAGLPVREVRADKDKIARALPATARMESGQVWFPPPKMLPVLAACEEELVSFPASEHDDFVDALAYAVAEIARGGAHLVTF